MMVTVRGAFFFFSFLHTGYGVKHFTCSSSCELYVYFCDAVIVSGTGRR